MKRICFRVISLLLCLMMCTSAMAEGVSHMPERLVTISAEAFYGDESMESVVIPEGAQVIGERAFAYSALTSVTLPASLVQIADDAFEGCEGLVATISAGSYAQAYCEEKGIVFAADEMLYAITGLSREGSQFSAIATTDQACILRVEVLPEDGQTVLHTVEGPAQEALDMQQVAVDIPGDAALPAYYVLRAVLVSEEGHALCNPFTTIQYTSAFEQFDQQKPEDFAESIVMNFGSAGYAVLEEGAVAISGTSSRTDNGYIIPTDIVPEEGTVLALTFADGTQEPIKVKTARDNGDGTATVQHDPDTTLSELFDVFKYDDVIDVGSAAQSQRLTRGGVGDAADGSASLSTSFTAGPLTISVTGTASIVFQTFYDEKLFGYEFVELLQNFLSESGRI